ncbi:MAG: peptidoglycan DD-metalloendopeptidase family protein, partial [Pseudomonadota bacterium]
LLLLPQPQYARRPGTITHSAMPLPPADTKNPAQIDLSRAYATLGQPPLHSTSIHPQTRVVTVQLAARETLSEMLIEAGIQPGEAFTALAAMDRIFPVRSAKPGLKLSLQLSLDKEKGEDKGSATLDALYGKTDFSALVIVRRIGRQRYQAEQVNLATQTHTQLAKGTIDASLYLSAEARGMPAATLISLIKALSYRVDFQREIRPGDTFKALYQTEIASDGAAQNGAITYAELALRNRVEKLYRFTHPKTHRTDYFDATGESMRRLLMRTPIDGARLTSGFGKRRHPVLGYVKNHQGVDFGAPTGTPIYAAGDGVIARASPYGSYGNYIRIKHPRGFQTAYAHLSRFARGLRTGRRVSQGDVIGYVGATGRVTGPHLHYEVYRGKKRVNPMRLDLPTGEVLEGIALEAFRAHIAQVDAQLVGETAAQ